MDKFDAEKTERIIRQYSDMIYRIAVHNCQSAADAEDILPNWSARSFTAASASATAAYSSSTFRSASP